MMSDLAFGIVLTIGMVVVFTCVSICITKGVMDTAWEQEAIRMGYAEYYLDKDFCKQWRWRTNYDVAESLYGKNEKSLVEKPVSEPGEPI